VNEYQLVGWHWQAWNAPRSLAMHDDFYKKKMLSSSSQKEENISYTKFVTTSIRNERIRATL